MPFRRNLRLRPVHSDKHEVTWSFLATDLGTAKKTIVLAVGVHPADKDGPTEVGIGAKIFGIYLEFNIAAETITNPKVVHWQIAVRPQSGANSSPNVYYQTDRSFIIKRGMEMLPKDVATVFKRIVFVPIPRVYQRMKDTMDIVFQLQASSTEAINFCGFGIYKEFD